MDRWGAVERVTVCVKINSEGTIKVHGLSLNNIKVENVLKEFGGKNFSTFKSKLSESIIEKICPIGTEINKLLQNKDYLYKILENGSKKANLIAKNNLKEIYDIIGLKKFS